MEIIETLQQMQKFNISAIVKTLQGVEKRVEKAQFLIDELDKKLDGNVNNGIETVIEDDIDKIWDLLNEIFAEL